MFPSVRLGLAAAIPRLPPGKTGGGNGLGSPRTRGENFADGCRAAQTVGAGWRADMPFSRAGGNAPVPNRQRESCGDAGQDPIRVGGVLVIHPALWLLYLDERDAIDAALGDHDIPVVIGRHVAKDAAVRWDGPGLECLAGGVEPHERVRPHSRLATPHRSVCKRNAIGLRLRPARRRVFLQSACIAFVEYAQHDVHRHERRQDQQGLVSQ